MGLGERLSTLLMKLVGRPPPGGIGCREAAERLYEYLDHELTEDEREKVHEHFEICRRCYPRLAFERSFLEAVARAREGRPMPPELRARVLEMLETLGRASEG